MCAILPSPDPEVLEGSHPHMCWNRKAAAITSALQTLTLSSASICSASWVIFSTCKHIFCLFLWQSLYLSVNTHSRAFSMHFTCDFMFVFHLGLFPSCCTEKLQTSQFLLAHRSSYDCIRASLVIRADTSISDHSSCGQPASHSSW